MVAKTSKGLFPQSFLISNDIKNDCLCKYTINIYYSYRHCIFNLLKPVYQLINFYFFLNLALPGYLSNQYPVIIAHLSSPTIVLQYGYHRPVHYHTI